MVSCFFAFTLISGSVTRFFLAVYIGYAVIRAFDGCASAVVCLLYAVGRSCPAVP